MNRKGAASILLILLGVALVSFIAAGVLNLGTITGSGGYIERPVFKYVKCEAISGKITAQEQSISQSGSWIEKPSISSSYDVIVTTPSSWSASLGFRFIEYSICNQRSLADKRSCTTYAVKQELTGSNKEFRINGVQGNQYVWVQYQLNYLPGLYKSASGSTAKVSYVPYGLREYNVLGGGSVINGQDCSVPLDSDTWKDRFVSSDSLKIKSEIAKQTNTQERTLDAEEIRWYVSGYVSSAAPSFALTYKGVEAWCKPENSGASIYKVNTLQVGSGTYKVASVDWSDKIGSVTCCPGDKQPGRACSKDFTWVSTEKAECSAFNPCDGGQWTPSQTKEIAKYSCVSGQCIRETKKVSCSSDSDCLGENKVCDRSTWSCKDGNVNLQGEKLITIPDNSLDCKAAGGVWVSEKSKQGGFLGIGAKDVVTEYCDLNKGKFPWVAIALLSLLLAGVYVFRSQLWVLWKGTIGRYF